MKIKKRKFSKARKLREAFLDYFSGKDIPRLQEDRLRRKGYFNPLHSNFQKTDKLFERLKSERLILGR